MSLNRVLCRMVHVWISWDYLSDPRYRHTETQSKIEDILRSIFKYLCILYCTTEARINWNFRRPILAFGILAKSEHEFRLFLQAVLCKTVKHIVSSAICIIHVQIFIWQTHWHKNLSYKLELHCTIKYSYNACMRSTKQP